VTVSHWLLVLWFAGNIQPVTDFKFDTKKACDESGKVWEENHITFHHSCIPMYLEKKDDAATAR